ncbi:MAG TPA: glycosyltransferase family 4 protein [Candidatus Acidoferrales bacterium]|nr:glycosyltransferase family 4 protein [Candidatus Acidoferrales bacterium]
MRIALVHRHLSLRGGTERVLYRTAEGLRDRGHEVHVFCARFQIPPPSGVEAHRVPCLVWPRTAQLLSFAWIAPRVVERHGCDVVMSFSRLVKQDIFRSGGGAHAAFIAKMARHENRWRNLWYRISVYHRGVLAVEKRQLGPGGCWRIVAVSEQVKRELIDYYRIPENRVVVIHNGVDHRRFHPARRQTGGRKIREELRIPLESSVVLFVGTGFRRKGLDRLLSLWNLPEFKSVHLLVVGNDAKLAYYRRAFERETIRFLGPRNNVEDYYAASDLFVLPSTQEAFGNVVLEALASGLPVVTPSDVGAAEKIDGELRQGLLRNQDDLDELRQKVRLFLDRARWPQRSQAARSAAEKYSWDHYLSAIETLLHEAAARAGRRRALGSASR